MRQTILIHGRPDPEEFNDPTIPAPSNAHWFPWLQKQLIMKGNLCQALEFPFIDGQPDLKGWYSVIENFNIDSETTLIGHSTGGGFILRYLSDNPNIKPNKVVLVAPWIDPEKDLTNDFFDFIIDPEIPDRTDVHVMISSDDVPPVVSSVEIMREKIPHATYHDFVGREHFCTPEFPELLALLK